MIGLVEDLEAVELLSACPDMVRGLVRSLDVAEPDFFGPVEMMGGSTEGLEVAELFLRCPDTVRLSGGVMSVEARATSSAWLIA